MRPRLFYEKSRIHDVSWGFTLFEGWDMLRRCEAILAWHMHREILCFSGQYLAMAQIRHSEQKQKLWTKMKENERKWTKMKENKRRKYSETLWGYACEFFTYLSIVVSDVVIAVCQGPHSLKWSRLRMTWHCSVWYGSIMFYMVLMPLLTSCHALRVF